MYLSRCRPFLSGEVLPFVFPDSAKGLEGDVLELTMQQ